VTFGFLTVDGTGTYLLRLRIGVQFVGTAPIPVMQEEVEKGHAAQQDRRSQDGVRLLDAHVCRDHAMGVRAPMQYGWCEDSLSSSQFGLCCQAHGPGRTMSGMSATQRPVIVSFFTVFLVYLCTEVI
jgi:hypothetical protein